MRLWDFVEGKSLHTYEGHSGWVNALALTADGKQIISASDDTTIKVWQMEGPGAPLTLCGHHHWVWDIALSADNKHLFSVSSDQTLKLWAVATGENLATFSTDSPLITCLILPDGQTVAAGAQSGQLHLLKVKGV
jgi:WD40 repeat protein